VNGTEIGVPGNHQMYFIGDAPCGLDGESLVQEVLGGGFHNAEIFDKHRSSYYFSHKLKENGADRNYLSLFEKFNQYYQTIAAPARYVHQGADGAFLDVDFGGDIESPFCFPDSFSAHAELSGLNGRLRPLTVGIIGLGGTGSYVLDFLAKMPVKRIRLFDDDDYVVKNAFRSPGTSAASDFQRDKVALYVERYSSFRMEVLGEKERISRANPASVSECDFLFVCVDKAGSRAEILALLRDLHKPFIDVGMGLNHTPDGLAGGLRATLVTDETAQRVIDNHCLPAGNDEDDLYQTNIQIAELNALNAAIAMIMFKKRYGFYRDDDPAYHLLMTLGRMKVFS